MKTKRYCMSKPGIKIKAKSTPPLARERANGMSKDLVAPCGMNCAICSGYLAFSHDLPKKRGAIHHCTGCRPRNKKCAFLKGQGCMISQGEARFCHECPKFPCQHLSRVDERYQKNYQYSLIDNLRMIARDGMVSFPIDIATQQYILQPQQ
jgi:hypothetical protein